MLGFLFGKKNKENFSAKNYAQMVKTDILAENLKAARDDLLEWARLAYKEPKLKNLEDISEYAAVPVFKNQLEELGKSLYSPKKNKFRADEFLKAFAEEQKKRKKQKTEDNILPKLYR